MARDIVAEFARIRVVSGNFRILGTSATSMFAASFNDPMIRDGLPASAERLRCVLG